MIGDVIPIFDDREDALGCWLLNNECKKCTINIKGNWEDSCPVLCLDRGHTRGLIHGPARPRPTTRSTKPHLRPPFCTRPAPHTPYCPLAFPCPFA